MKIITVWLLYVYIMWKQIIGQHTPGDCLRTYLPTYITIESSDRGASVAIVT